MKRFVFVTDNHGDMIDPVARDLFFEFVKHWKPNIRIHGGDVFDYRALRKNASVEERRDSMASDVEAGMDFLEKYRPHHILWGNHDKRLWDTALSSGPLADYAHLMINNISKRISRLNTKTLPYHANKGVLKIGKMKFAHGYFHGVTAAKKMAEAYGSCLFGHIHTISAASVGRHGTDRYGLARSVGCLCKLDMAYNSTQASLLGKNHGWAYGTIRKNGLVDVYQALVMGRSVVIPDKVKLIKV